MALLETQPLRTSSSAVGTTEGPASAQPRSALTVALSTNITAGESSSARSFLRYDRHGRYDFDRYGPGRYPPHGPYRPGGPYYPPRTPPYYPSPLPPYYPAPSPFPGPLPGERACSWFEQGRLGSRQDIFGQWWCRW